LKILLHICCAPCAIYPLEALSAGGHRVRGFFFNPNIHPYQEFARRAATLQEYASRVKLPVIWDQNYNLEEFLRGVAFRESERCRFCYYLRISAAARVARGGKFDAFTTTLLYSKFQNHDLIRELAQLVVREVGVPFYYEDFRRGWSKGAAQAKKLGLYKQQYCGCIFSERDRFLNSRQSKGPGLTQTQTGVPGRRSTP
jgi:predicted adenine nucleotide alpha hydrolase (AANH) superfamily ATPase